MVATKKKSLGGRCRGKPATKCRRRDGCKFVSGKKRRYCRTLKNKRRRGQRRTSRVPSFPHEDSLHIHIKKQFRDARDEKDIAQQRVVHAQRLFRELDSKLLKETDSVKKQKLKSGRKKLKKDLNRLEKCFGKKQKKFDSIQKKYRRMDRELGKLSASYVFY